MLVTLLTLLALSWLPEINIGQWSSRSIDLLADMRSDTALTTDQVDLKQLAKERTLLRVDTCRPGMTCIDDMADTTDQGMTPLYDALTHIDSLDRPVRIAVLGDSYIEGDILTCDLRELLQEHYGGCGVGFVPVNCVAAGFRRTVITTRSGWEDFHANEKKGYGQPWANITGNYFRGSSGCTFEMTGGTFRSRVDTCQSSTLYFMGNGSVPVTATVNGADTHQFTATVNGGVQSVTVKGKIGKVRWSLNGSSSGMMFLGATMDCDRGVLVDNYSLRSSTGMHLAQITEEMFANYENSRHYDLVIIMFGLNVAGRRSSKFELYCERMTQAITAMKKTMPHTGFLLVTAGDRDERAGGGFRTMAGVKSLIKVQQQLAFDNRVAFWNLYEAMGGEGSVARMTKEHMANLDYTHINFEGGKKLARLLYDAIVWGQENYRAQLEKGGGK